jgi:RHS repeat-associated protein
MTNASALAPAGVAALAIPDCDWGANGGDHHNDLVVYRPSNGTWYAALANTGFTSVVSCRWGTSEDIPLRGADFDGDGLSDLVTWRPSNATWSVLLSSTQFTTGVTYGWGQPGDVPIVGDFDGDHKSDLVVWRPSDATWYIMYSSTGYTSWTSYQWGIPGDVPMSADFDGDGLTDLVVWRPSDATWYVRYSSHGYSYDGWTAYQWGQPTDIPMSGDFDGDGRTDLAIWRPSDATWYVRYSSRGYSWDYSAVQWGQPTDTPLNADVDEDRIADEVVYRPTDSRWYVRLTATGRWTNDVPFGTTGDVPLGPTGPQPSNVAMAVDTPSETVQPQPFALSGWAVDLGAASGTGVDAVHVWALSDAGGDAEFWGAATYGTNRPEVAAYFGRPGFANSGWTLPVTGHLAGAYQVIAYTHSAVTGRFSRAFVVHLSLPANDGPSAWLTIDRLGAGTGGVTSQPAGLSCAGGTTTQAVPCAQSFPIGSTVTLTAVPDVNQTFAGWSGACTGTAVTCTITVTANTQVGAAFDGSLTSTQYYHLDAIGSVRAVTDASGVILERHDYRPFGEDTVPLPQPGGVAARFTGQDRDAETGFDDFGARYYSMHTGRFGGVDPIIDPAAVTRPQRWSRYAHAANSPMRFTDPTGTTLIDPEDPSSTPNFPLENGGGSPNDAAIQQANEATWEEVLNPALWNDEPNPEAWEDHNQAPGTQPAPDSTQLADNRFFSTLKALIPSVCGGGGFGYGGIGWEGPVHGEALALVEYDSRLGGAHGGLLGAGVGYFTAAYESLRTWSDWQEHNSPIGLGGIPIPGATNIFGTTIGTKSRDIGGLAQYENGTLSLGLYGGLTFGSDRAFGGGGYFTISWSGCGK